MAGVSFPFSLQKQESKARKSLYLKIIKRGLILFFFGMLYNGFLNFNFETFRVASVLGRIGLAWMFAALLFINTKTISRIIWCAGLMIAYWLVTILVVAPDYPSAGVFTQEGNITAYIDRILLPGRLNSELFDPEGILGTIPAISTALLGMLTGQFVLCAQQSRLKKAGYLAATGAALVIIAQVWNLFYPINKSLWSSSFVCMAGGCSMLLFALFYLIIDVWGKDGKFFFFFKIIGLNSITVYMATRIIPFNRISSFFFQGIIKLFPENWSMLLSFMGNVTIVWLFLYFLYKQKIFLKV
ncbi:hypothetical protein FACS18947_7190 [Bacteroidia bacterium]|nr:hypothetical protein FACS18947_7190 [Bacteroidia bacterium]